MLDGGVGVAVALEYDCLALVLIEEDFVLERAAVLGPNHFHGLLRQPLPFLDLARVKFDPGDALDLVHCLLLFGKTREATTESALDSPSDCEIVRQERMTREG